MTDFEIITRRSTSPVWKASLANMSAHVNSACNSCPNGRYSDYSDDQIRQAFSTCNVMFEVYISDPDSYVKIPAGLALIVVKDRVATIELFFTLPAGKGKMLISKLLT